MQFKCRFNSHSQLFLYKSPLVRKARVASQFHCLCALFSSFTPSCPELSSVISCHRVQSEGLIFLKTLPRVLESSPLWHSGDRGESRVSFLSKHRCDRWLSLSEASQWTIIKELWSTVAKESFSQETFFSQFLPWSEMNLYTQRKKKSTEDFFFLNCCCCCCFSTFYLFIMAVSGLRFCPRAFSSCGKWGPLFVAVHRPLTVAASLVAEHRLQTRRLSSCGSRA